MITADGELVEGGELAIAPTKAIEALNRVEIDIQIATAKKYRRETTKVVKEAEGMACVTPEIASSCFYRVPRGGKTLEGPSVRLAEIFCVVWGNVRYGARVIDEDDRFITAQGFCHDLQTNAATTVEVRRRITDKYGKRFNDDMIAVTGNAACSIALRNAVFKVIPRSYVDQVFAKAKEVAIGEAKSLDERRSTAVDFLTRKMNVPLTNVLHAVKRSSVGDIDLNDLQDLQGLRTAVKDGEITVDAAFPPPPDSNALLPSAADGNGKVERLVSTLKPEPKSSAKSEGSALVHG